MLMERARQGKLRIYGRARFEYGDLLEKHEECRHVVKAWHEQSSYRKSISASSDMRRRLLDEFEPFMASRLIKMEAGVIWFATAESVLVVLHSILLRILHLSIASFIHQYYEAVSGHGTRHDTLVYFYLAYSLFSIQKTSWQPKIFQIIRHSF